MKLEPPHLAARSMLARYGLDEAQVVPVERLLAARRLLVREAPLQGAEGRLVRDARQGIVTVSDRISSPEKRRFVLAHELGHFELHEERVLFNCDAQSFVSWQRTRPEEYEANAFAAELLMPFAVARPRARELRASVDTIRGLARCFHVSLTGAAIRFTDLTEEPCAVVFTSGRTVAWWSWSSTFPYRRLRSGSIHADSGAAEFYSRGAVSSTGTLTPVHAWFYDGATPGARLYEGCLAMPRVRCTLSVLWLP